MKAIITIASVITVAFIGLGILAIESYVAMTVWRWHVGPWPSYITLWQLIWINAAVSCMIRQWRGPHSFQMQTNEQKLIAAKDFITWALSPLLILTIAWILKLVLG